MVIVSESVRKKIESIKEIVGYHSDSDVYNALKESNMDLDDATQKLLHQGTFHEVKKRRDKKKENPDYNGQVETRKYYDTRSHGPKFNSVHNGGRGSFSSGRSNFRGGHTRRGSSREFFIAQDNRVNQNFAKETKPSSALTQAPLSAMARRVYNVPGKCAYVASNNQRQTGWKYDKNNNDGHGFRPNHARECYYSPRRKHPEENTLAATGSNSRVLQSDSSIYSNAVKVYESASEPVHAPPPDSRSPASIGAKRHDIGGGVCLRQLFQSDQEQTIDSSRGEFSNHFNNRSHHKDAGTKGAMLSKEWKPKTNHQSDTFNNLEKVTDELQHKLSQTDIHDNTQKAIIAQIPEFGSCKLTFRSNFMESNCTENRCYAFQTAGVGQKADTVEPVKASPSNNQTGFSEQVQSSAFFSPVSEYSEQPVHDTIYFRHPIDDTVRQTGWPFNQQAPPSQTTNIVSTSSLAMMQPPTHMAQLYPQVHLPQFTNVMPYAQYLPPIYTPPIYPHLSNTSSYVAPRGTSHVTANGIEHGIQHINIGMQSAPYLNTPSQILHSSYMQSHSTHLPFNSPAAQSSQMQFSGMYASSQPSDIHSAHIMTAGNINVGVTHPAPLSRVMSHQPAVDKLP